MDSLIDFSLLAITASAPLYYLWVAIWLGLVIFFHELGHFAVAKWCDVKVERFSIGFGPILWRTKRGETEYALSAIPFGGYVKMLGQDDMDPSQLTQEEIAEDPRSFSAKSVPQRMAIISAGVIMNIVTGLLFFAIAFQLGVQQVPRLVGGTQPGYPAWVAGLREGDRIDRINGRRIKSFGDIKRAVALSSSKELVVEGVRWNAAGEESKFRYVLQPYSPNANESVDQRLIGVMMMMGLELADFTDGRPPARPGTPAADLKTPIEGGSTVVAVGDRTVSNHVEFESYLTEHRKEGVDVTFRGPDGGEERTVEIAATPFRTVGLRFEIGQVAAVQQDSPAANAGLQRNDKITHVVVGGEEKAIGKDIDPLFLPQFLYELHGQDVTIKYSREEPGRDRENGTADLVPLERPGWTELPMAEDTPLSIPAIGLAFHLIPQVANVEEKGPAAGEVPNGAKILEWRLVRDPKAPQDNLDDDVLTVKLGGKLRNVAHAFWLTQQFPSRKVQLLVKSGEKEPAKVDIETEPSPEWYQPGDRGLIFYAMTEEREIDGFGDALGAAVLYTRDSIVDIYLTLRNVFIGELSATKFSGPVGIFKMAKDVAEQGIAPLLLFLGILSMNLAVINFLPIPVLDGGHMVFLIWEGVTRRKPSETVLIGAQYVGLALVLGLLCFVMYLDLFFQR